MKQWPQNPLIYEINTWVWLNELSQKYRRAITLDTVPSGEWDSLSTSGFDAIWFMGVWERSPAGKAISNQNKGLCEDFRRALPDFQPKDNVGSAYCIRKYAVDAHLGGSRGLAIARKELTQRGLKLMLDFVPNHVAPDHPWAVDHPEYFVQGNVDDVRNDPASFVRIKEKVFACGRDPYFPAWQDVLQLNAFQPGLRQAVIETLSDIAGQCDGVRCDMAMLLLNTIFERTWGKRAGFRPPAEYWVEVISAIKKAYPDFLFMAEAYWDLEWELQQQGFDYCYDKRLYDRLEHESAENIRLHLSAAPDYQKKLVRFIENHDEPRAASAFLAQKGRVAAVVIATIPGAKLFHEGQFEGRKVRLPVFLSRRPVEPQDEALQSFYRSLINIASSKVIRGGVWQLCERSGWEGNASYQNLIAWCWRNAGEYQLIVVNLSGLPAQAKVRLPWDELMGKSWQITDHFSAQTYERSGDEMCGQGLYVDLPAWGYHVFARWQAQI